MKPLHFRDRYGTLRQRRATTSEVARHIDGKGDDGDELVHVIIDDHGDIVATPLTADEIKSLRSAVEAERAEVLREMLDGALRLHKLAERLGGATVHDAIVIDAEIAPWAANVINEWAAERNIVAQSEPRPTKATKHWQQTLHVYGPDVKPGDRLWTHEALVTVKWPYVEVDPEKDIAAEGMCVGIAKAFESEAF